MQRLVILATTALATLIPAMALSMPGASIETVGVYGDWTSHVLGEGKLRLCYAETKLIPPSEATQGLGDARLQVTGRSVGVASDMVRLTRDTDSLDMEIRVKIGSADAFPLKMLANPMPGYSLRDFADFYGKLVEDMKVGEAAKVDIELGRATDGVSVGNFSLVGFTEAYEEAGNNCSVRRYRDRHKDPVAVSGISVVAEPSLYSEFSFSGPLFRWSKRESRITIRALPDNPDNSAIRGYLRGYPNAPGTFPEGIFLYGSDRLAFYADGKLVDVYPGGFRNGVDGVCFDPESDRLRLLMHSWSGGAPDPARDIVLYSDHDNTLVGETISWLDGGPTPVDCSDDESVWEWNGSFFPCLCAGKAADNEYNTRVKEVLAEIGRLSSRSRAWLHNLLIDIARLQPWVQWDIHTDLEVQRFESSKFEVVVVTYQDHLNVYRCAETIFVRRLGDEYHVPVYGVGRYAAGRNTVQIHGFVDDDVLDVTLCVEDCDARWGETDRVTKNLREWWREKR